MVLTSKGAAKKASAKGGRSGSPERSSGRRTATWSSPEVAGFPPEARYSHTATAIGPMLFIVGGLGRKGRPFDDMHVLDLTSLVRSLPRVTHEGPAGRGRHATVAVGSVLFIFGGGAKGEIYEDVWTLDGKHRQPHPMGPRPQPMGPRPQPMGPHPHPMGPVADAR